MLMMTAPATWEEIARRALEEAAREEEKRPWLRGDRAEEERSWYIATMRGKSDRHVLDQLKLRKVENYYPQVLEMRRVPRKKLSLVQRKSGVEVRKPTPAPLFPRYIFLRVALDFFIREDIERQVGIGGMKTHNDHPVIVPDALIESIRRREHHGLVPGGTSTKVLFSIGDEVMVTSGPFASFPGIVERGLNSAIEDLDPNDRISVAVSIFGRPTSVELGIWQVDRR